MVREQVRALDRNLPIQSLRPFEESLAATLKHRRFVTTLRTLFAGALLVWRAT